MIDIVPPMSSIDPHLPAQDSPSVRLYADNGSDTFYPLPETPAAALVIFMDALSVLIFLRCLVHALWLSSKLFVSPSCLSSSMRFVDIRTLCPLSVRIDGTVFLSFLVELLRLRKSSSLEYGGVLFVVLDLAVSATVTGCSPEK